MGLLRTALEGHDLTLRWGDFQGSPPANRSGGEAAYVEARFDLAYDYDWDDSHGAAQGYRVDHVNVKVSIEPANMWSLPSARNADLLRHEQGHYDIVALVGRDLFEELTGWNSARPPKRFRKDADLKTAVGGQLRKARRLAAHLAGSAQADGVYDKQTNHGQDAKAQGEWNKGLAAARTNGTAVLTTLAGVGASAPP